MKRFTCAILISLLTAAGSSSSKGQPIPSYPLPEESGQIIQIGPDGITSTQYTDHGRSYNSIGPRGFVQQQNDGLGNYTIKRGPSNKDWADVYINSHGRVNPDIPWLNGGDGDEGE